MTQQTMQVTEGEHLARTDIDLEAQMQLQALEQNRKNAACAVECGGGQPELLTPEQVRSMTRREVRDQYALIIESMKHWQ